MQPHHAPEPTVDGGSLALSYGTPAEREVLPLLGHECERFLAREVDSQQIDRDGCIPTHVLEAAASIGLFGLTLPEEHGGLGLTLKSAGHIIQMLARVDRSLAITVGLHVGLGTRGLVRYGTRELQAHWLPRMAFGECITSFAATEPGAGSDLNAIQTKLQPTDTGFGLGGYKAFVTNGGFASAFTVLAKSPGTGGARAHSMVIVPRDRPGITIGREERKLGIRGSSTVPVHFDDVPVDAFDVIGSRGRGMEQAHAVLAWGRTLMAAGCVGTAEAALRAALEHTLTRTQFGRPISAFAATRMHLCDMAATIYAMETAVRDAADHAGTDGELQALSLAAKVLCSEGACDVADRAIQLHGASGFLEETGVAMLLRDARVTRIFEGANDVLLVLLGVSLISSSKDRALFSAGSLVPSALWRDVGEVSTRLRTGIARTRAEYGVNAVHRQLVLQRLARAAINLRSASGCAARAANEARSDEASLGMYAAQRALVQAHRALDDLERADRDEAACDSFGAAKLPSAAGTPSARVVSEGAS